MRWKAKLKTDAMQISFLWPGCAAVHLWGPIRMAIKQRIVVLETRLGFLNVFDLPCNEQMTYQ